MSVSGDRWIGYVPKQSKRTNVREAEGLSREAETLTGRASPCRNRASRLTKFQSEAEERKIKFDAIFAGKQEAASLAFYYAEPSKRCSHTSVDDSSRPTPRRIITPPPSSRRTSLGTEQHRREVQRETLSLRTQRELQLDRQHEVAQRVRAIHNFKPVLEELKHIYITDSEPRPQDIKEALGRRGSNKSTATEVADQVAKFKAKFRKECKQKAESYRIRVPWNATDSNSQENVIVAHEAALLQLTENQHRAIALKNYPREQAELASRLITGGRGEQSSTAASIRSQWTVDNLLKNPKPSLQSRSIAMNMDPGRDDVTHPPVPWLPPKGERVKGIALEDPNKVEQQLAELGTRSKSRDRESLMLLMPHTRDWQQAYLKHRAVPVGPALKFAEHQAREDIATQRASNQVRSEPTAVTTSENPALTISAPGQENVRPQEVERRPSSSSTTRPPIARAGEEVITMPVLTHDNKQNDALLAEISPQSHFVSPQELELHTAIVEYESVTDTKLEPNGDDSDVVVTIPTSRQRQEGQDGRSSSPLHRIPHFENLNPQIQEDLRRQYEAKQAKGRVDAGLGVFYHYTTYLPPSQIATHFGRALHAQSSQDSESADGLESGPRFICRKSENNPRGSTFTSTDEPPILNYGWSPFPQAVLEITDTFQKMARGLIPTDRVIARLGEFHEKTRQLK